jgi:anti-anti-sigma regulatory factor
MRAEREQDAHKGRLVLTNLRDTIRQIFDVAGLSQHFKISSDLGTVTKENVGPGATPSRPR